MSVSYQQLLHNVALRMSALVGTQVGTISATYDSAVLDASHFKSADWPFTSFRDAILMAVEEYVWAIADNRNHTWRALYSAATADIANNGLIPSTSSTAKPIIGVWGAVVDSLDNTVLTDELDLATVRRLAAETWRTHLLYHYQIDGRRLVHTRPNVKIDVCVFSRTDELALWTANGNMSLPDVLEPAVTARAVSLMTRDGAFTNQAKEYRDYSNDVLIAIRAGQTIMPKAP
jgi:hypothetical protein